MEEFLNSLTMAEQAQFESLAGFDMAQAENNSTPAMFSAIAAIALARLGTECAPAAIATLSTGEITELAAAAATRVPSKPADIVAILEEIRGRAPKE